MESISSSVHSAECFIREEEELFLVFEILFNLYPGITLTTFQYLSTSKQWRSGEILKEIEILQLTRLSTDIQRHCDDFSFLESERAGEGDFVGGSAAEFDSGDWNSLC